MPGKKKTPPKTEKSNSKRPIEQYDHKSKTRINNAPVGLVTPRTDPPVTSRKTYAYDPHLDPQLVWAGKGYLFESREDIRCLTCTVSYIILPIDKTISLAYPEVRERW